MEYWSVLAVILLFICTSGEAHGDQRRAIDQRFHRQDEIIANLHRAVKSQESTIRELQATLASQERVCSGLAADVRRHDVLLTSQRNKRRPDLMTVETTYGCPGDELSLTCPNGKQIFVETADFGEYTESCSGCCAPAPLDCTELVSDSNTADWVALKLACDNQTTCTWLFQGSTFVDKCTVTESVHYILAYYTCQPVSSDDIIAFTVFPTETRNYTVADSTVIFDGQTTNKGEHFDLETSVFLCPRYGFYFFSLSLFTPQSQKMVARIMKDTTSLTSAYADLTAGENAVASTSVVTQCDLGQKIWVRSLQTDNQLHGGSTRYTSFTGFLVTEM